MDVETRIYVNNDLDIVIARLQTRELAKKMGFNTADQARISLAASEMARVLAWMTRNKSSEMIISNIQKNDQQGLQVISLVKRDYLPQNNKPNNLDEISVPGRSLVGACRLVDESVIEPHNDQHAQVTLIKWLS